jgi:ABC-type sugar transport system substrate-binding protein
VAACSSTAATPTPAPATPAPASGAPVASAAGSATDLAWAQPIYDTYSKQLTDVGISTPLGAAPAAHKKVAWLEAAKVPVFTPAVVAAGKALNWDVTTITYDDSNPTAVNSAMQQAVDKKVDYIAVSGAAASQFQSALANAMAAKIPVFSAFGPDDAKGSANGIYVQVASNTQTSHQGELLAALDIVEMGGPGSTVLFNQDDIPPLKNMADGFVSSMTTHCPTCKVDRQSVAEADVSAGKVPQLVASYIQSHPDVKVVAFGDGATALGVDSLLKTGGLLDKVKLIGQSPEAGSYAALLAGTNVAWVGNPFRMVMWYCFDAMARYSEGMTLDVDTSSFMPNQIYTKDSDKTFLQAAAANPGEGPTGYQQVFAKLWLVGQ